MNQRLDSDAIIYFDILKRVKPKPSLPSFLCIPRFFAIQALAEFIMPMCGILVIFKGELIRAMCYFYLKDNGLWKITGW